MEAFERRHGARCTICNRAAESHSPNEESWCMARARGQNPFSEKVWLNFVTLTIVMWVGEESHRERLEFRGGAKLYTLRPLREWKNETQIYLNSQAPEGWLLYVEHIESMYETFSPSQVVISYLRPLEFGRVEIVTYAPAPIVLPIQKPKT